MSVYSSFSFKFETFGSKIEEETQVKFSCREIVHELNGMNYRKPFNGLCFDNQTIIDKKIGVKIADLNVFIKNVESFFAFKENIVFLKLDFQRIAVNGFQKSAAERSMYFHGKTDDAFSERIFSVAISIYSVIHDQNFLFYKG